MSDDASTSRCCACCGKTEGATNKLKTCTGCRAAAYCDSDCQTKNWKAHKLICQASPETTKPAPAAPHATSGPSSAAVKIENKDEACSKKKKAALNATECANCGCSSSDEVTLSKCARCGLVEYCGTPCQTMHWKKGGHKKRCVSREERSVAAAAEMNPSSPSDNDCSVCTDPRWLKPSVTLQCGHTLHAACIEDVREYGAQEACPSCRSPLPSKQEVAATVQTVGDDAALSFQKIVSMSEFRKLSGKQERVLKSCIKRLYDGAKMGHAEPQFNLGSLSIKVRSFEMPYKYDARSKKRYAKMGHAEQQFNLGSMSFKVLSFEMPYKEAMQWLHKAADQGHADAQFLLGCQFQFNDEEGEETLNSDYKKSFTWYKKAAEQGHLEAQHKMGVIFANGFEVERDYKEALKWYQMAADQGDAQAKNKIGVIYEYGHGQEQNYKKALKWYREAAKQKDDDAQNNIGNMYRHGRGVEQDFKEALKWYKKAADQGCVDAQYNVGSLNMVGLGEKPNLKEAMKWFKKAAGQGDAAAQEAIAELRKLF